ncbi:arylsulfatase B-like [Schistocerca piceifrons]|uniref:arylsulfatase B-like n=1 Tax=Schistocerca piceifrons TaxID=274613 RepID=UPI001F5FC84C|nr:arylsulfatase B-like [Schistocerca piceifrons]
MRLLLVVASVWLVAAVGQAGSKPPNIVFIVADDMGWNDVSFHGSDQVPTPNIDALAYHGVILNGHYVQPVCTPSRSAIMTGKYPVRLGMQGHVILGDEVHALPEGKILPQYLKDLGYVTRAIGKWHLGHYSKVYTPTYRGFDSHLGYWNAGVGYYDYIFADQGAHGYDLRENLTTAWQYNGKYATDVFTEEAERLIRDHDTERPLFLYLAHLACHPGDHSQLINAPQDLINSFSYISHPDRRILAAVMAKMDESVGRVVTALHERDMLNNSIIVFVADNGAGSDVNWGSNFPFRGIKNSLWEGAVHGVAAVWSPLLQNTSRVDHELMHISDWLPTLYAAAGGNASDLPDDLDGVNMWPRLVSGEPSQRTEILLNYDEVAENGAVRVGDWKLVKGVQNNDYYAGASGAEDPLFTPAYDPEVVLASPVGQALSSVVGASPEAENVLRLRAEATVSCPERPAHGLCNITSSSGWCVFNIRQDPCEAGDGAPADMPEGLVDTLLERLETLSQPLMPQPGANVTQTDLADPKRWNNTWVPWVDCIADNADPMCNVIT